MNTEEFFAWCAERGLTRSHDIAAIFRVSSQTIRNWQSKPLSSDGTPQEVPAWVPLACLALDTEEQRLNSKNLYPATTVSALGDWQREHGFKSLDDTGSVFKIKRQAVHNWYSRGSFPKWLPLACAGYDASIQLGDGKDSVKTS